MPVTCEPWPLLSWMLGVLFTKFQPWTSPAKPSLPAVGLIQSRLDQVGVAQVDARVEHGHDDRRVARRDRPGLGRVDIDVVRVVQPPLEGIIGVVRGEVRGLDRRSRARRIRPPDSLCNSPSATDAVTPEVSSTTSGPSGKLWATCPPTDAERGLGGRCGGTGA